MNYYEEIVSGISLKDFKWPAGAGGVWVAADQIQEVIQPATQAALNVADYSAYMAAILATLVVIQTSLKIYDIVIEIRRKRRDEKLRMEGTKIINRG